VANSALTCFQRRTINRLKLSEKLDYFLDNIGCCELLAGMRTASHEKKDSSSYPFSSHCVYAA
jgi:hypothetical protein